MRETILARAAPYRAPRASDTSKVFVYVIATSGGGHCKVGISVNPGWRLNELQSGNPEELFIEHVEGPFSRDVARALESAAHEQLSAYWVRGAWFDCASDKAAAAIKAARGNSAA